MCSVNSVYALTYCLYYVILVHFVGFITPWLCRTVAHQTQQSSRRPSDNYDSNWRKLRNR